MRLISLLLSVLSPLFLIESFAMAQKQVSVSGKVEIGMGWDSDQNRQTNNICIDHFESDPGTSQIFFSETKEITDKSSLLNDLGVSAKAKLDGVLGIGSASAEFKFATNFKIGFDDQVFLVKTVVWNDTDKIKNKPGSDSANEVLIQLDHRLLDLLNNSFKKIVGILM